MKTARWWCGVVIALALTSPARAQFFVPYPFVGYGYSSGAGLGFGFSRSHFGLRGFLGAGYSTYGFSPYGFYPGFGFGPYGGGYNRITINYITPPPLVVGRVGARVRQMQEEENDISGVDLDLIHPDDLTKPRAELEQIMERERARRKQEAAVPIVKKRVAPPAEPAPVVKIPPPPPPKVKKPAPPEEPAPKLDPEKEFKNLLGAGLEAFRKQLYGVAGQQFFQGVKTKPASARAHFLFSQAQFALGKYTPAVQAIQRGLGLQKDWPLAKFDPRAELYQGNGDFPNHLKRLENVLAANPKNADFMFLLAHQLWFTGDRVRAVELLRRARPLTPDPVYIDLFLGALPPGAVAAK